MMKALVKGSWELFDVDELQPETSVFNFERELCGTLRKKIISLFF